MTDYLRTFGLESKPGKIKKSDADYVEKLLSMYKKGAITERGLIIYICEWVEKERNNG
jgi:hypothetical protein